MPLNKTSTDLQARTVKMSKDSFDDMVVACLGSLGVFYLGIFSGTWCDLNCQRREGSQEHLWAGVACALLEMSPSKAGKKFHSKYK